MAATKKSFSTVLSLPQQKKHVVRYDGDGEGIVANIYANKSLIAELGNPDKIKVTVEAA